MIDDPQLAFTDRQRQGLPEMIRKPSAAALKHILKGQCHDIKWNFLRG